MASSAETLGAQDWDFSYVKPSLAEITRLTEVDSLNDPEELPFKSKYAAREVLETLKKKLCSFLESYPSDEELVNIDEAISPEDVELCDLTSSVERDENDDNLNKSQIRQPQQQLRTPHSDVDRVEIFLRYIQGKLGFNYIDCEETSSGEEHLNQALGNIVTKFSTSSPWTAYIHMYLLNQLGILQATRRQNEKASKFLHNAEATYASYKSNHSEAPSFPTDLLSPFMGTADENNEQEKWKLFEAEHTQTLFYLAQVYQKSEEGSKAAHYCQLTLMRQLEQKQYQPVEWALNAATLSQYFLVEYQYTLARHCLSSAMKIFEEVGEFEKDTEEEGLYSKSLDIKRCWVKYGLSLLEFSWMRLVADEDGVLNDVDDEPKIADLFDLELTRYESWMPDKYLLDFGQARPVFLKIQEFLGDIKQFYTLDSYCSDYIELTQDHSKAYKNLSVFETEPDRRSKMHKRRVDLLEAVTKELNPQYYLLVWRQLVYETAEAYSAMVDCKVEIMNELGDSQPSSQAVSKLNSLCQKSIHKYLEYVGSLKGPDGSLPDPIPEGDERPLLVAWFCIARLYYKMSYRDPEQQINCMKKTLEYYKLVVETCDKQTKYATIMEAELPVCREMASLLVVKIDRMVSRLS
ncbi:KIF-binding protein-like [Watersipora subatra]|uniref:KIF-binding protein-like n=1 Tax=Watersipora subatra TaxID=2589382 RepID=UPI00355B5559